MKISKTFATFLAATTFTLLSLPAVLSKGLRHVDEGAATEPKLEGELELAEDANHRELYITGTDVTIWGGTWGGWKPWKDAGTGYYACGAQVRFEDSCGGCDDTAANGLKLAFCSFDNWYLQKWETIWDGNWGSWKNQVYCPPQTWIVDAQVRFEDSCGACDDTALNGLQIKCAHKDGTGLGTFTVYNGKWGGWKGFKSGTSDRFVTGARVRYEDPGGDDTAWNGLQFKMDWEPTPQPTPRPTPRPTFPQISRTPRPTPRPTRRPTQVNPNNPQTHRPTFGDTADTTMEDTTDTTMG